MTECSSQKPGCTFQALLPVTYISQLGSMSQRFHKTVLPAGEQVFKYTSLGTHSNPNMTQDIEEDFLMEMILKYCPYQTAQFPIPYEVLERGLGSLKVI